MRHGRPEGLQAENFLSRYLLTGFQIENTFALTPHAAEGGKTMTARFYAHPDFGVADSATKRVFSTLSMGRPKAASAPISAWNSCRVAESGHSYASAFARIERKL